jgi:hypothetical protein
MAADAAAYHVRPNYCRVCIPELDGVEILPAQLEANLASIAVKKAPLLSTCLGPLQRAGVLSPSESNILCKLFTEKKKSSLTCIVNGPFFASADNSCREVLVLCSFCVSEKRRTQVPRIVLFLSLISSPSAIQWTRGRHNLTSTTSCAP